MDQSILNRKVQCRLLHEKNLIMAHHLANLTIKEKRRIFFLLRTLEESDTSYILPGFFGATIGEFCTIQVLCMDSRKKFHDFLDKEWNGQNQLPMGESP